MKPARGQNIRRVKMRSCLPAILLLLTCIVAVPWSAGAGTPLEELKCTVDRITGVLDDKALRESLGRDALLAKLTEVSQGGFDWNEIAERSLGLYWKERTAEEKSEFTQLLKNLLLDSYLTKIIDNYSGESVIFDRAHALDNQIVYQPFIILFHKPGAYHNTFFSFVHNAGFHLRPLSFNDFFIKNYAFSRIVIDDLGKI